MNNYCTFYIVRHAQTVANIAGIVSGSANPELSDLGINQAKQLGGEFKNIDFAAVYTSDFIRAQKTAELILLNKQLAITTVKALRERNWGILEGTSKKNLQGELRAARDAYNKLSYQEKYTVRFADGMETDEEMMGRFITFLREVAVAYAGKNVLLVTHGNMIRTFLMHLGLGTPQEYPSESVKNTGYVIVKSDGVEFEVVKTVGIEKVSP